MRLGAAGLVWSQDLAPSAMRSDFSRYASIYTSVGSHKACKIQSRPISDLSIFCENFYSHCLKKV